MTASPATTRASTICGSGCARSATSTPASIASCWARRDRRGARRSRCWRACASVRSPRSLLGPAAALGLSGRVPGLVTGTRDAFVVALYLGALLRRRHDRGLAASSAFVVSLARRTTTTGSPARGRRAVTRRGALVTVLCLVYLTLWWQTVIAGARLVVAALDAFGTGVAVAISLLLGHAVTVATLRSRARGDGGTRRCCRTRPRGRRVWLGRRSPAQRIVIWRGGAAASPGPPSAERTADAPSQA